MHAIPRWISAHPWRVTTMGTRSNRPTEHVTVCSQCADACACVHITKHNRHFFVLRSALLIEKHSVGLGTGILRPPDASNQNEALKRIQEEKCCGGQRASIRSASSKIFSVVMMLSQFVTPGKTNENFPTQKAVQELKLVPSTYLFCGGFHSTYYCTLDFRA